MMSNFEDIFNSFFGKPGFHRKNQRDDLSDDEGDQNAFTGFFSPGSFYNGSPHDMDEDGPPGRQGPFPRGGIFSSFDNEVNDFFRLFDDMFKSFGVADFPPLDDPRISPPPPGQPEEAPRDLMLKEPDSRDVPGQDTNTTKASSLKEPLSWFEELRKGKNILSVPTDEQGSSSDSKKVDSDLDGIVRQGEIERIFGGSPRQPSSDQTRSSYSRSVSIQTIRRPDGTYETRRTERDDKGNVTTTVNTGTDSDASSPGRTEPRTGVHPWGMHPWRSSPFWPGTRRSPGPNGGKEEERGRTDDGDRPWRPGMFWPGSRRRCPGKDSQQEEVDEAYHQKFFGSWFKH